MSVTQVLFLLKKKFKMINQCENKCNFNICVLIYKNDKTSGDEIDE